MNMTANKSRKFMDRLLEEPRFSVLYSAFISNLYFCSTNFSICWARFL